MGCLSTVGVGRERAGALTKERTKLVLGVLVVLGGEVGGKTAEEDEDDEDGETKDDELAQSGVARTVLGPGATASANVLLDLVGTELVVDETAEGNAVAKGLETGDGVAEDEHRGKDEEDILEDTGQGEDEGRGLANLQSVSTILPPFCRGF